MASTTSQVVPAFDFSAAQELSVSERFRICIERARELVAENGYDEISDFPCVPDTGATDVELQSLESDLGVPLPGEYHQFLSTCRYLKIDDSKEVGGFDHAETPWVSGEHRSGVDYLIFANFWEYADGDQLMFDLSESSHPVIAYLHEHGPLFELYAPSFSLALWRLVHEIENE